MFWNRLTLNAPIQTQWTSSLPYYKNSGQYDLRRSQRAMYGETLNICKGQILKVPAEIILELRKSEQEFEEVTKATTDCQASTQFVLLFEQKQNHDNPSFKLLKQNESASARLCLLWINETKDSVRLRFIYSNKTNANVRPPIIC